MITEQEITPAGSFIKTHGIKGELNAMLAVNTDFFIQNPMFICDMDGIFVPFFIESIRPKSANSALILPSDVNSDDCAKPFVGKTIYILKAMLLKYTDGLPQEDCQGEYADDLIGYTVSDKKAGNIGVITDIEDSTANILFIIRTPEDKTLYVPVADPFIIDINNDCKTITTDLPDGLVDLNK